VKAPRRERTTKPLSALRSKAQTGDIWKIYLPFK